MSSPHKLFEKFLVEHKSRYTLQKRMIATEIFKTRSHFEIEEFIAKQRIKKNRVARATVYRTVKQLFEAGLIQKIDGQEGKVFYECCKPKEQHDHLICKDCGKIMEFNDKEIEKSIQKQCDLLAFKLEYRSIHIYGKCDKCQKKMFKKQKNRE